MSDQTCPLCKQQHNYIELKNSSKGVQYYEIFCQENFGGVRITTTALANINCCLITKNKILHLLNEKYTKDRINCSNDPRITAGQYDQIKDVFLERAFFISENKNDLSLINDGHPILLDDLLKSYPKTILEKLNRALCNMAREISKRVGRTSITINQYNIFANDADEIRYHIQLLVKAKLCTEEIPKTNKLELTIDGWKKFEELERNWQNSTTAFIAMWFNDATEKYREAVKEAIRRAGYEPQVIDEYEHNNFIMDEVINKINEAKFVIADFTCVKEYRSEKNILKGGVRGGVYFEAGYAKGLGKEVIVTCKDDEEANERRHFDIDQLNTLFWNEKEGKLFDCNGNDFTHRLAERIKATVGKGKLIN